MDELYALQQETYKIMEDFRIQIQMNGIILQQQLTEFTEKLNKRNQAVAKPSPREFFLVKEDFPELSKLRQIVPKSNDSHICHKENIIHGREDKVEAGGEVIHEASADLFVELTSVPVADVLNQEVSYDSLKPLDQSSVLLTVVNGVVEKVPSYESSRLKVKLQNRVKGFLSPDMRMKKLNEKTNIRIEKDETDAKKSFNFDTVKFLMSLSELVTGLDSGKRLEKCQMREYRTTAKHLKLEGYEVFSFVFDPGGRATHSDNSGIGYFCTICPHCSLKHQYERKVLNIVLCCQKCSNNFLGHGNMVYVYSALASAYPKNGFCDEAIGVFVSMNDLGWKPNLIIHHALIDVSGKGVCSALTIPSLTASLGFGSALKVDVNEFDSYSSNFTHSSHAYVIATKKASHEELSVSEITNNAFEPSSMMVKCDPRHEKYMTYCLMNMVDVVPKDVNVVVADVWPFMLAFDGFLYALSLLQLVGSNRYKCVSSQADEEAYQLSYLQKYLGNIISLLAELSDADSDDTSVLSADRFEHLGFLIYFGKRASRTIPLSQNTPFFGNSDSDMPVVPVHDSQVRDWLLLNIHSILDHIANCVSLKENDRSSDQDVIMLDVDTSAIKSSNSCGRRPISLRVSFVEMVMPYGDLNDTHISPRVSFAGEDGLGKNAHFLKIECDCSGYLKCYDAHFTNFTREAEPNKNCVCLHEEDLAVMWRHEDGRTYYEEVRRSRRLIVSFICTLAIYEYDSCCYFYPDGKVEAEVKLIRILSLRALQPGETRENGATIAPGLYAPVHQYFVVACTDRAVVCKPGERYNQAVEMNIRVEEPGKENVTKLTAELLTRDPEIEKMNAGLEDSSGNLAMEKYPLEHPISKHSEYMSFLQKREKELQGKCELLPSTIKECEPEKIEKEKLKHLKQNLHEFQYVEENKYGKKILSFKIHDMVHELVQDLTKEFSLTELTKDLNPTGINGQKIQDYQFPNTDPWGQGFLKEGGIVITPLEGVAVY